MKQRIFTLVGVVALLVVLTTVASAQTYYDPGIADTNVVLQNKATGAGEVANVVVAYYDTDGNLDYTNSSIQINPLAVREVKTTEEPALPDGWEGSAVVSSDRELAAIVSIRWRNSGRGDGWTQGAYVGLSEGSRELYMPAVYRHPNLVSRITVQNTESTQATIYMNYYDRDGAFRGTFVDNIPGYAQETYFLGNNGDVPPGVSAGFVDGSIYITSTNRLAGVAVTTWAEQGSAYQSLKSGATTLYAPSHYRHQLGGAWNIYSAIILQNTTATPATVYLRYINRSTGNEDLLIVDTIPPFSARGFNTLTGASVPASTFDVLGTNWAGSVNITSTQPIVGVCNTLWARQKLAGTYALVSPDDGSDVIYVPAQYRRLGIAIEQWSAINLQNVGDAAVNDITVRFIDQSGNTVKQFTGISLQPGQAVGLNTRTGGDYPASEFNALGTNFIGGAYITAPAGSKLVAVANIVYTNRGSVYNGIPK
jgi:hypothetical protein